MLKYSEIKEPKKINLAENDIAIRYEQKQYVFSGGKIKMLYKN